MADVYTIELKKVAELENPMTPGRHPVGMVRVGKCKPEHLPQVDQTFALHPMPGDSQGFATSKVTRIVHSRCFETMNSRYEWDILN